MFEEIVETIGFILMQVIIILTVFLFISCIVACFVDEIKESKEKRKTKETARESFTRKGDFYKLKGIDCQETDEKKRQLYEVMQNFKEFCNKYKILFTIENFQWYIEIQLMCYKYKEEEK